MSLTPSPIPSLLSRLMLINGMAALFFLGGCGGEQFAPEGNNASNSANAVTEDTPQVEPTSSPGRYGGTLTEATISDPKTLNLWVAAETSSTEVVGPLTDALIGRNSYTLQWEARLAELPEVSTDGLTWTFNLKPDLKWSDGQPLTADDVIFTLDVIYDPSIQTNMREGMMVDVERDGKHGREPLKYRKIDARTVEFRFPARYAPAREMLSFPIAPRHKLLAAYKAGNFNNTWNVNTNPKELVSCGAWVLDSYRPGQRLIYSRNPHYWEKDAAGGPLPYLEHLVLLIVSDINTTTLKFQNGETDVLAVSHKDYALINRGAARGKYKIHNLGPGLGFTFFGFNLNPNSRPAQRNPELIKLFRQQKFRQAVSHAINRERICRSVYQGLAQPMWGPETPANKAFYNPKVPTYPYDPERARRMLQELGLKDADGNGKLELPGSGNVSFNILTNVENNLRTSMATIISSDLQQVGLDATFTPINFNSLVTRLDAKPPAPYDWQAMVLGFTGSVEPNNGRNIWQSSGNLHQWHPYQKTPATPWEKEIDDIFRKGAQEMDEQKRKALYDRYQVIAAEQLPFIFLVLPDSIYAVRDGFGNLKPTPTGGVLWNVEELYRLDATGSAPR